MPTTYRRATLFAFVLCATASVTGWALAQDDASEARMRKDITYLASDECEGRGVGTKGLDLAADYIAKQFKDSGLKPGGVEGTYFQPFPFATKSEFDGDSALILHGPDGKKIALKPKTDFQIIGFSGAGKVTAPLVFAGYGVTAKGIDYDDYKGLDVKGKVVVTLRRLPRWTAKDFEFDGANKDTLAALTNKQSTAHAHNAAAVILVNDATEPKDGFLKLQLTTGDGAASSLPYVQIKRSVLDDLLKSATGKSLADTEKAIDGDLKPHSAALTGWTVELEVKIKRQESIVKNILGVLEGKGPLANETVVIGAHYDHLGFGGFGSLAPGSKGKIHHGADDNGSGTTTVIELARRFGAMKDRVGRRLVFMTFTAEERGLIGSRHYTRAPLFPLKDTTAMVNLDMVGRVKDDPKGGPPKLLVEGADTAKEFDALLTKLNPGFNLVREKSVFGASDHFSFYQQKIPVIFFWTGTHPDYHRPTDTADKINVPGMKKVADFAERVIVHLSTEAKRPEFVQVKNTLKKGSGGPMGPRMSILPDYEFAGKGLRLDAVTPGGAADLAGMKAGDVIIEIAGKAIANVDGYMVAMQQQKVGVAIEVKVLRDKKELQLKVTPK